MPILPELQIMNWYSDQYSISHCWLLLYCQYHLSRYSFQFSETPPNPRIQPKKKVVQRGEDVAFNCSASGDSLTEFAWYRNMEVITKGTSQVSRNSNGLILRNVSDSNTGVYQCRIAGRGVGYWFAETLLQIKDHGKFDVGDNHKAFLISFVCWGGWRRGWGVAIILKGSYSCI